MNSRQRLALALLICGGLTELAAVGGYVVMMEYSYLDARDIRRDLVKLMEKPGVKEANLPRWSRPELTLLIVVAVGGLVTIAMGVGSGLWPSKASAESVPSKGPLQRDWSEQAVA